MKRTLVPAVLAATLLVGGTALAINLGEVLLKTVATGVIAVTLVKGAMLR